MSLRAALRVLLERGDVDAVHVHDPLANDLVRFLVSTHDTATLGFCADFAHDFFARVPSFVWDNLGVRPPAFRADALAGPQAAAQRPELR